MDVMERIGIGRSQRLPLIEHGILIGSLPEGHSVSVGDTVSVATPGDDATEVTVVSIQYCDALGLDLCVLVDPARVAVTSVAA